MEWYQGNYLQKVTFYSNEGVIYTLPVAEYQNMPDRRIDRPMFRNNHFLIYRSPELISKLWPRARSSGCEHNQSNFEMKASVHGWHHWFLSFVDIGPFTPSRKFTEYTWQKKGRWHHSYSKLNVCLVGYSFAHCSSGVCGNTADQYKWFLTIRADITVSETARMDWPLTRWIHRHEYIHYNLWWQKNQNAKQ